MKRARNWPRSLQRTNQKPSWRRSADSRRKTSSLTRCLPSSKRSRVAHSSVSFVYCNIQSRNEYSAGNTVKDKTFHSRGKLEKTTRMNHEDMHTTHCFLYFHPTSLIASLRSVNMQITQTIIQQKTQTLLFHPLPIFQNNCWVQHFSTLPLPIQITPYSTLQLGRALSQRTRQILQIIARRNPKPPDKILGCIFQIAIIARIRQAPSQSPPAVGCCCCFVFLRSAKVGI